jgi:hypothetical protein
VTGIAPDVFLEMEPWLAEAAVEVAMTDMQVQHTNAERDSFYEKALAELRGA